MSVANSRVELRWRSESGLETRVKVVKEGGGGHEIDEEQGVAQIKK